MIIKEVQNFKVTIATPTYVVKYIASPINIIRTVDNTIIKKGC